jgi:hypothetical protein
MGAGRLGVLSAEALEDNIPQGQFVPNVYTPIVTTRELTEELRMAFTPAGWDLSGVTGAYFNNADRHYYVDYLTPNYATLFSNSPGSVAYVPLRDALSQYISDNYAATTRTRMFTNQPRTAGVSLQWKF